MYLPEPDTGRAWLTLLASFLGHCIAGYSMYAIGLFHIVFLEKFQQSISLTSWIGSVFLFNQGLSGPLASFLINRWSCRTSYIIGSILVTASFLVTAFVNDVILAFIFFGIFAGIGMGLLYTTGYIVLAFNFERLRKISTGIAVSGASIGPFIFSPLFQMIHETYSYTGFFILFGGITLNGCVLGAVMKPSKLEFTAKTKRKLKRVSNDNSMCSCNATLFKDIPLLCLFISCVLCNIGLFMVYLHFPKYAIQNGSSVAETAWYLSLAGITGGTSRILLGLITNNDHVSEDVVYFISYALLGGATIVLPYLIDQHALKVVYAIVLGMNTGTCYVVLNSIVLRLTGPESVAQGTGYVMVFIGIGILIGPPLGGFVIDNGGSYDVSFLIAGLSLIAGAFVELCSKCFHSDKKQTLKQEEIQITVSVHNQ